MQIPAEVEGVLTQFPVREGARVKSGDLLAAIDDRVAKAQVEVAQIALDAARERASDDVEKKYAEAASAVAGVNWQKVQEANQGFANAVPDIDIRQKKLEFRRSLLQIEKADKDIVIAKKEAEVKQGELKAAQIALDRRTILAPFDGEVQQLYRHRAEWVNPGEPILTLVQFDVLYVDGAVKSRDYDPVELQHRKVTVVVHLAQDREATLEGRVVYVNQTVEENLDDYTVRAEIQNQRVGDAWLVRPGLHASMTIHLREAAEPPVPAADAPAQSASLEK